MCARANTHMYVRFRAHIHVYNTYKVRCSELEREREPLVQELIAAIDGHTRLHHAIRGTDVMLEGVGMVVRMVGGRFGGGDGGRRGGLEHRSCMVKSVLEGGSSAQAMLQDGDELITINGVSFCSLSIDDVQNLFRGPAGTLVDLTGFTAGGPGPERGSAREAGPGSLERGAGHWFSVRLLRRSTSRWEQDEDWTSISRKTSESVKQAQQLHAEFNSLYSKALVHTSLIARLTDALNKARSVPVKKTQGGRSERVRGGGGGSGRGGIGGSGGGGGISGSEECAEDEPMVGVGMRIRDSPPFRVMSLVHGCSALACDKIRVGDTLLAVNDVSVQGMNFRDLRKCLVGSSGSQVKLSFAWSSDRGGVSLPGQLTRSSECLQYSVTLTRGWSSDQGKVARGGVDVRGRGGNVEEEMAEESLRAEQPSPKEQPGEGLQHVPVSAMPASLSASSDLAMGSTRGRFAKTSGAYVDGETGQDRSWRVRKARSLPALSSDNNGHATTSDRAQAVVQKVHIEEERERAPAAAGEEGYGAGVSVEWQVATQVHLALGASGNGSGQSNI